MLPIALFFESGCAPKVVIPTGAEFTGKIGGCGHFFVYRFNDVKTLAVTVSVNEKAFDLSGIPKSIDISQESKEASVDVLQFRRPAIDYFCDDVAGDAPPTATWKALSGDITVEGFTAIPAGTSGNATHKVSVVLRNVKLREAKSGRTSTLSEIRIGDVFVGWAAS
jgi:hypothetical protein